MNDYPINQILDEFLDIMQKHSRCIVSAAPGAGKTTVLPLHLLDAPWRKGKILILEPRRLAVYAAASRLAENLGCNLGERIGYRMRFETCVSRTTEIELITEGILTRMIQNDPELSGISAVIFDEYHERSLHGDTGLALAVDVQNNLRPDLKIIVMSATLDVQRLQNLLDAPVVISEGRRYPVTISQQEQPSRLPLAEQTAGVIIRAMEAQTGSLLVFLPGEGAIRKTAGLLKEKLPHNTLLFELYGRLDKNSQRAAIAPPPPGKRKVVLATSIAETSLTIEDVRIVIDSGLTRRQIFSPATGMNRLETVPISRAAADQRAGRAGRLEPGVCYRLWTAADEKNMPEFTAPEISCCDLTPLVLELAAWGVNSASELCWLDPPPPAHWAQATEFLMQLGALDHDGRITENGRKILASGLEPRLGLLLHAGFKIGLPRLAAQLAALLSEFDSRAGDNPDIRFLLDELRHDKSSMKNVNQLARKLANGKDDSFTPNEYHPGLLLAFAYPDRIGKRRTDSGGHFLLSSGRGAVINPSSPLSRETFIVAAQLDAGDSQAKIFLAAPLSETDLYEHFTAAIEPVQTLFRDDEQKIFRSRTRMMLGKLPLSEKDTPLPEGDTAIEALLNWIRDYGLELLPWTSELRNWRARMQFLHQHQQNFPDFSDTTLMNELAVWLKPFCPLKLNKNAIEKIDLQSALKSRLSRAQLQQAEKLAPEYFVVPSGSRIRIDYTASPPVLAVKLQEMFGCRRTPQIMNAEVNLLIHLLSPAMRPVQITADLEGFWKNSYQYVRADLRGRYPKHDWPEDPANAIPRRGVKKS
ncbi:MAG: ATP-dependent helicase HrpB [Victivallaceae bacterium]|jgi:ATP-dependent helicase HrpB|nr:ATP-dependent helicase HrpB [Victivallaceae bacterium]MDD5663520.1 ATP-dependent helicase HrpB [Victivallaceae bacterium]